MLKYSIRLLVCEKLKETVRLRRIDVFIENNIKVNMLRILFVVLGTVLVCNADDCKPSITTASGSSAPQQICSGQLIFDENFDSLNKEIWRPLSTFSDGGVSY